MLICVPKSDFRELSDGEIIALFEEDLFLGYSTVLTVLDSIIILEVGERIAKLYEDSIKSHKSVSFRIF